MTFNTCNSSSWIRWITQQNCSSISVQPLYYTPPLTWLVCLDQATRLLNGRKRRAKRFESRNKDWGRTVLLDRLDEWHVVDVIRNKSHSESAHWLMRLNKHATHEERRTVDLRQEAPSKWPGTPSRRVAMVRI